MTVKEKSPRFGCYSVIANLMRLLKIKLVVVYLLFCVMCSSAQDGYIGDTPRLAYWSVGGGADIIIVLHGGAGASHSYLRPEWDSLGKIAQVIYYDQRGCGKSERANCYGWREQVADLKKVIAHFSKGHKVILAGSSWGTHLALLYAYLYPQDIKGLILSGTMEWTGRGKPQNECSLYLPKDTSALEFDNPFPQRGTVEYKFSKGERKTEKHYTIVYSTRASMEEAPTLEELKRIKLPMLMFEGGGCEGSALVKDHTQTFKDAFSNLEVYQIQEACHDPWYTHTEDFFAKCIDYVMKL